MGVVGQGGCPHSLNEGSGDSDCGEAGNGGGRSITCRARVEISSYLLEGSWTARAVFMLGPIRLL